MQEMGRSLQWHEPAAFRRFKARQYRRDNPWEAVKVAAITFACLLGLRAMSEWGPPNPNLPGWPMIITLSAGIAFLIAYGLPWLILLFPNSIVILSEKGVNNNTVQGSDATIRFWPWDKIAYCRFAQVGGNDRPLLSLQLHDEQGQVMASLGLREKPTLDEIRLFLQMQGKKVEG